MSLVVAAIEHVGRMEDRYDVAKTDSMRAAETNDGSMAVETSTDEGMKKTSYNAVGLRVVFAADD